MNRDEIIKLAEKCGARAEVEDGSWPIVFYVHELEKFANEIRKAALMEAIELCKEVDSYGADMALYAIEKRIDFLSFAGFLR